MRITTAFFYVGDNQQQTVECGKVIMAARRIAFSCVAHDRLEIGA
jgi:hypothetical protein